MIARLAGTLLETTADHAIVDVGGVGYLVACSGRTLSALGPAGSSVTLHTEMQVAEDFIRLIGFASAAERDWFRLLTAIQGVGGKVALALLSTLSPDELHTAVAHNDVAMIGRAPGVGPKLAQRICNELKDKAGAVALGQVGGAGSGAAPGGGVRADALAALASLGFRPGEAAAAVAMAAEELGPDPGLDALVRLALRKAAR